MSDVTPSDDETTADDAALAGIFGSAEPEAPEAEADAPAAEEAEVIDAEDLIEEEPAPRPKRQSPYDRPGSWYVVHTQSGYEKKVKSNIESRINSMNMEDSIFEVLIPMEDVIEFKNGKKVVVQK